MALLKISDLIEKPHGYLETAPMEFTMSEQTEASLTPYKHPHKIKSYDYVLYVLQHGRHDGLAEDSEET